MITIENFKQLLANLGFVEAEENIWRKEFEGGAFYLEADFKTKELKYPEAKGLVIHSRQTCNFSDDENFVVFEAVHRLLVKGYKPEHIELEPKWKLGRGASGGRADILVKNQEGMPLLLIECKTAGNEFRKAWKETQQDGGQLFSYAQQIQETSFLCLYASDFDEKTNQVVISQQIILHKDNKNILNKDTALNSFEKAKDVKERYEVWKTTYQLESTEAGIFEDSIQPYQIGKNKYTLAEDTQPLNSIDKKGLYHTFRTILRKHNVSRRENAFDVLVNLFLCKIIDETEHKTDLKFRWKGIAYDNYYDLVDRLQGLYQAGMKKFLNEDILYVSNEEIDKAFWTTKTNRNATKTRIKEIFRELKFYKGLDFEFIKVHNPKGFDKNAKILIDIIQMWQSVRLTSQTQNQFLGDMFEHFLDNGIKQSEGQFFTPIPICKFVVASLPLEQKISQKTEPLKVIDYACGSGHFLTEYAIAAKPIIEKYKAENALNEHYKHIFGIEKEDRLAKVATVSACMYGQKDITVIDTDALGSHEKLTKQSFDVLVANPPFAVDDFLRVLAQNDEKEVKTYELFSEERLSSNNIQCFFLERAKQLLAREGVAGIIVPTSILSNSDAMHVQTREILLKYFNFVSIVELGSGTFGKTGTNTVVLFLKRKAENPEQAEHFANRTLDFFEDAANEIASNGGIYQDLPTLKKYCAHIDVPFEDYQSVLIFEKFDSTAKLWEYDIFKEYKAAFDKSTEVVNLHKKTDFKKLTADQQAQKLNKMLFDYVRKVEQNKLFYFMLAYANPQKVLIVKSPADNKEQKQFLGYEWNGAKGQEGIKYNNGETVYDIQTPLFNPNDANDSSKISYWIAQNFNGKTPSSIPENLTGLLNYTNLVDLLDFSRTDFNKNLSLTPKNMKPIETKWQLIKVEDAFIEIKNGKTVHQIDEIGKHKVSRIETIAKGVFNPNAIKWTNDDVKEDDFLQKGDILFSHINSVAHLAKTAIFSIDEKIIHGINLLKFRPNSTIILPKYAAEILKHFDLVNEIRQQAQKAINQASVNTSYLNNLKIPVPPLDVQQKIVSECEAIDQATEYAKAAVEKAEREIEEKVESVYNGGWVMQKLNEICKMQAGKFVSASEINDKQDDKNLYPCYGGNGLRGYTKTFTHVGQYCLIGRQGALCGNVHKVKDKFHATEHAIVVTPNLNFNINWLYYQLRALNLNQYSTGTAQPGLSVQNILPIKIPVPPMEVQEQLIGEIEELEKQILAHKAQIDKAGESKQAVLKKYL